MVLEIPPTIPAPTAITIIGGASGVASYITMMAIAKKIEGRIEITTKEVVIASIAVGIGSMLAYYFVRGRGKEELPTY